MIEVALKKRSLTQIRRWLRSRAADGSPRASSPMTPYEEHLTRGVSDKIAGRRLPKKQIAN